MFEQILVFTLLSVFLFVRTSETYIPVIETQDEITPDVPKIRCPQCQWQPAVNSRWDCSYLPLEGYNGCGYCWNTFETEGKCPGCDHQLQWTTCLQCYKSSLHQDWYG